MDPASGEAMTSGLGRGASDKGSFAQDDAVVLPSLPTGESLKSSIVLHCDTGGRPYRAEDFVPSLKQVGVLSEEACLGAYQMGHVGLLKLKTPEAKGKLLSEGQLQVKGRRCLVIDPHRREIRVKLHWATFDMPIEAVCRAFDLYGDVKDVVREK